MSKGKEQQKHGFLFEKYVINKYNLIKEKDYVGEFDAYTKIGVPLSVKAANKKNDIALGDIFRQANLNREEFYLVIGFHDAKQGTRDNPAEITLKDFYEMYIIKIKRKQWIEFFNQELVNEYKKMVEDLGDCDYYDENHRSEWETRYNEIYEKWLKSGYKTIRPRNRWVKPSKDGETGGHRIQCAMRYSFFAKEFLESGKYPVTKIESNNSRVETYKEVTKKKIVEDTKYGKKVTEIETEINIESKPSELDILGVPNEFRDDSAIISLYRQHYIFRKKAEMNKKYSNNKKNY